MTAEGAELARAVVGLLDLIHEYGPSIAGAVALWLARQSAKHSKESAKDAKAARERPATSPIPAQSTAAAAPAADKPRNITDSGIIRIAGYLEKRINEVDKRKAKHANEDAEAS